MGRKPLDLTGRTFGKLTAREVVGRDRKGNVLWRCSCACGGERVVRAGYLTAGVTFSCGCEQRPRGMPPSQAIRKRNRQIAELRARGWTFVKIGAKFGLTHQGASYAYRQHQRQAGE